MRGKPANLEEGIDLSLENKRRITIANMKKIASQTVSFSTALAVLTSNGCAAWKGQNQPETLCFCEISHLLFMA